MSDASPHLATFEQGLALSATNLGQPKHDPSVLYTVKKDSWKLQKSRQKIHEVVAQEPGVRGCPSYAQYRLQVCGGLVYFAALLVCVHFLHSRSSWPTASKIHIVVFLWLVTDNNCSFVRHAKSECSCDRLFPEHFSVQKVVLVSCPNPKSKDPPPQSPLTAAGGE